MSMLERLDQDLKNAMKAKNETRLAVIRSLKTALKNRRVQLMRDLSEEEILAQIAGQAKQRKDSIEQFAKGGRDDLVAREEAELAIIEAYLPKQLGAGELEVVVEGLITETGASSVKDMGRVMKALMSKYAGRVDGKVAGELVKMKLSGGR